MPDIYLLLPAIVDVGMPRKQHGRILDGCQCLKGWAYCGANSKLSRPLRPLGNESVSQMALTLPNQRTAHVTAASLKSANCP